MVDMIGMFTYGIYSYVLILFQSHESNYINKAFKPNTL
jgi:hypothetical protein